MAPRLLAPPAARATTCCVSRAANGVRLSHKQEVYFTFLPSSMASAEIRRVHFKPEARSRDERMFFSEKNIVSLLVTSTAANRHGRTRPSLVCVHGAAKAAMRAILYPILGELAITVTQQAVASPMHRCCTRARRWLVRPRAHGAMRRDQHGLQ